MLTIDLREKDGVTILDLNGRLVFGPEAQSLSQRVRQLVADGKAQLLVNMSGVTFIDSCGVGELIAGFTTASKSNGTLKLTSPIPLVAEVLRIVRVPKIVEIFEAEEQALASFH